ncbi:putative replication termination factor [Trypanosoma cruzi]|nr:putative replication termination factor [Trypanosoma cruzi]
MGGDGQALSNKRKHLEESRAFVTPEQLRKGAGKEVDVTRKEKERIAQRWAHCALSLEPLETPVVFDLCGRLYSKRAIVNELLERRHRPKCNKEGFDGGNCAIAKLSDVCEVKNVEEGERVCIRCPLSGFEASSGLHKFVGFWGCGHVVCTSSCSDSVMKKGEARDAVPGAEPTTKSCLLCGEDSFQVPLILESEDDEVAQLQRLRPLQRLACKRKRLKN